MRTVDLFLCVNPKTADLEHGDRLASLRLYENGISNRILVLSRNLSNRAKSMKRRKKVNYAIILSIFA